MKGPAVGLTDWNIELPPAATAALLVLLFTAYYVWDTSQSQRTRFRMIVQGTYVPRPWQGLA